jgi:endonuclease/exonuclease/phosphatase (EEP) superfamily protein YafD
MPRSDDIDDGAAQTIVLGDLNASAILSRLMSVAGTGGQAATEVQQGEAQSSSTTAARLAPLPTPLQ